MAQHFVVVREDFGQAQRHADQPTGSDGTAFSCRAIRSGEFLVACALGHLWRTATLNCQRHQAGVLVAIGVRRPDDGNIGRREGTIATVASLTSGLLSENRQ